MENLKATTYRGYSQVSGNIALTQLIEFMRGNTYREPITRIREALAQGDSDKADRIKRQLPYFTITANYLERRLPYSLLAYNDILPLDFDDMPPEELPRMRRAINDDPATLASFLSPRSHGVKPLVYLTTPEARALRMEWEAQTEAHTYAQLETYHKAQFELARKHYEDLLNTPADPSGSDLSRGFYATYDPEAFISTQRLAAVQPLTGAVALPDKDAPRERKTSARPATPRPAAPEADPSVNIEALSQQARTDYDKALAYTRRKYKFTEGERDSFIYTLANRCYSKGIPLGEALLLVKHSYGNVTGFDLETPLRNAYDYTSKTDRMEQEKKRPIAERIYEFLQKGYEFRRNTVLDTLEFRSLHPATAKGKGHGPATFQPLRGKDINSIYMQAQARAIYCSQSLMKTAIDSDYARDFDPFRTYFEGLPAWDGTTDYIGQLASLVQTTDTPFWEDSLRRWLVGMVACAIDDELQNQLFLLLYSKQGRGKSFFIRNLLPPELRKYSRNGMINPHNKDHMLMLSTRLIINMEEFDSLAPEALAELKHLIAQDLVLERKAFDTQAYNFVRRASFIGSTNNPHCLQDIGENRRFLFNNILSVDYHTPVCHTGIYAQAMALFRNGFHYWYEGDEINQLNQRNEHFRLKEPVEENLYYYYRPARPAEGGGKWLPAAQLLATISLNGRVLSNKQTQQTLVTVLNAGGFRHRTTNNGITEYAVMEYTQEQRNENAVQPVVEKQEKMNIP